jgi:uncharacterized phage-associated protein
MYSGRKDVRLHKSLSVAQRLLDECKANGQTLTPLQLMKLVYIAHGYMLGTHGRPLLDESVQAWKYGPVVPSVYHAVKGFGSDPVDAVKGADPNFPFTDDEKQIIKSVAATYGKFNGITLSSATHAPGTPWKQTWDAFGKNAPISNDLIENFYSEILKKEKHSTL